MRRVLAASILIVGAAAPIAATADAALPPNATYIVVLRPDSAPTSAEAAALTDEHGGRVDDVIEHALDGFMVSATAPEAEELANDPRVAYVERDRPVAIDAQATPTGISRIGATTNTALRINGVDSARADVDVAIIDTGIDFQQPDLNVAGGVNCVPTTGCTAGGDDDNNPGHGTHVAGIVGALDNGVGTVGVAAGARLWAVKVLDSNGDGTVASVIRGVDWVTAHAATIEVANLSLGVTGFSQAMHDAIQAAVNNGVAFAVAAGNSHVNVVGVSPASFDNVLTVSALADFDGRSGGLGTPNCIDGQGDLDDTLATFSNFGPVDMAAPGMCINSTLPLEHGSYGQLSGTSMAAPHVAGALALLARAANPNTAANVFALYRSVIGAGAFDWTDNSGDGVTEPRLDVANPALFSIGVPPVCASINTTGLLGAWKGEVNVAALAGPALQGVSAFTNGVVGQGFLLDSSTSLSVANAPTVSTGVTVEAWIRPTDRLRAQALISRWDDAEEHGRSFRLNLLNGGILDWATDDTGARRPEVLLATAPTLFDGANHHVAATWDSTTMTIYVDGIAVASKPSQGGVLEPATTSALRFGTEDGVGDPLHYSGLVDEPSVWTRALTAAELAAIFDAAAAGRC